MSRNVTIKGGIVMRSITGNVRRATRDIDLDFIHFSINDDSVKEFVKNLNCIPGINIDIQGTITELKHQDYHGKRIEIVISDNFENVLRSKVDIGVHNRFDIVQEEYCFDIFKEDTGVNLLINSVEQTFVEKLRPLLLFGINCRRYKDIYDMFYLKDIAKADKIRKIITQMIFEDNKMKEKSMDDIIQRVSGSFTDEQFLKRISTSRQRWIDDDIHDITQGLVKYLIQLK